METKYRPSDLLNVVKIKRVPPNCDLTLQIKPTLAHDGYATAIWKVDENLLNGHDVIMGGFLCDRYNNGLCHCINIKSRPKLCIH